MVTTDEAAQRIAEALARMERGDLDLDEAHATAAKAQAFASTRNMAQLEAEVEQLRETVARLQAKVKDGGMK
jgi:hypothetical protein